MAPLALQSGKHTISDTAEISGLVRKRQGFDDWERPALPGGRRESGDALVMGSLPVYVVGVVYYPFGEYAIRSQPLYWIYIADVGRFCSTDEHRYRYMRLL